MRLCELLEKLMNNYGIFFQGEIVAFINSPDTNFTSTCFKTVPLLFEQFNMLQNDGEEAQWRHNAFVAWHNDSISLHGSIDKTHN